MKLKVRKIRLKIHAFDVKTLNACCEKIIVAVKDTNDTWEQDNLPKQILLKGPIPLPTKRRIYCVLRSPHVDKDSREHFEIKIHKKFLDIYTVEDAASFLNLLQMPTGAFFEILPVVTTMEANEITGPPPPPPEEDPGYYDKQRRLRADTLRAEALRVKALRFEALRAETLLRAEALRDEYLRAEALHKAYKGLGVQKSS